MEAGRRWSVLALRMRFIEDQSVYNIIIVSVEQLFECGSWRNAAGCKMLLVESTLISIMHLVCIASLAHILPGVFSNCHTQGVTIYTLFLE